MRCVLRFSLFIVDGKLAISAPHGRADPVWAGTRGLRNSCSLATILLSPRFLNGSPPPPCPLLFLCIRLVFSPGCFVSAPHPSIMPLFLSCSSLSLPSITLYASVSIPCSPASLSLLVPLPAFCPSLSKTAVSLCRRSGGPGTEEKGVGSSFPPHYPSPS